MEMFLEIWKYSLPLIGVFIGWLLSQLSERNKAIREDRKKMNRTIYYLLEIRHQLSFISSHDLDISTYICILKKKFQHVMDVSQLDNIQVQTFLRKFVHQLLGYKPLMNQPDIESLNQNFNKCIDNLSEIDPLVAFRLNGKNNIHQLLKELVVRSQESASAMTDIKDIDELPKLLSKIEPNVISKAISDIEEILLDLAKKAGKRTLNQINNRLKAKRTAKEIADMETFVDSILADIILK